ncbi:MAG: DNA topoisomerase I [Candidatus Bathyarchaeota archaeon BA1]|nr:MAG: DNA topoisomerase I [Candidatus Bathyarchaeota archaeon BA1]
MSEKGSKSNPSGKCEICSRESINKYCELHEKAYKIIVRKYDDWRNALGITWKEYLNEVARNPYTGSWAREVAEHLMKSEG